MKLKSLS